MILSKTSLLLRNKGQTLIEVVVVIAVMVIVVSALTFATIASLRNAQFAKNQSQATKLAQEGLEKVRVGRNRNQCVTIALVDINSWDGGNTNCSGTSSFWDYAIYSGCGSSSSCYFNVGDSGALSYLTSSSTFPPSGTEPVPTPPSNPLFKRTIIISDSSISITGTPSYKLQKTVTSIVQWTDVSGTHESRLTTILRKI